MSRIKRGRPSPAILVAVMALVAALAGTALAGSGPSATTAASLKKVEKTANKAKKKAKKANKAAKAAQGDADSAQGTANSAQGTANSAQETADDATPLGAVVSTAGTLVRGQQQGATSADKITGDGAYEVIFNRDVSTCIWVAQLGLSGGGSAPKGQASTALRNTTNNGVFVRTTDNGGTNADRAFHLLVHCP